MANITELQKPTAIKLHAAKYPVELIDTDIKKIAAEAQMTST